MVHTVPTQWVDAQASWRTPHANPPSITEMRSHVLVCPSLAIGNIVVHSVVGSDPGCFYRWVQRYWLQHIGITNPVEYRKL